MQNFTLGKKGKSMLFLTFILLTFSFSSYAQENCPTVSDTTQDFCYLATVSDLEATANGDTVRWYRTATSTNPIPENELLQTGTYYAGNASGSCTNRVAVNVEVDDFGSPTTQFGVIFQPCEFSEDDSSTVQDLINLITGNEVEIFAQEFSAEALDPNTVLIDGNSYFAGQRNPDTNCRTSRLAIRYDPILAEAPTGDPAQEFCQGATVADLEAQATNPDTQAFRWYSTATSQPALAPSTELIDGETYYASQIINRSNSSLPPCESIDRFAVTVTIQQPVDLGSPTQGIICESDVSETFPSIDAIRNFYLSLLPEGIPTNGIFDPTPSQLAQQYQNDADGLGDFTTVYTVGVDGCESSVELTATIVAEEAANAGTIEDITVECGDENVVILDDSILSEDATTGGTFSGEGINEDGNFDPAIGPGNYVITYFVDDNADCVIEGTSASTTFTITVQGAEELGEPIVMEMCITEVQALLSDFAQAQAFFQNILDENGITNLDGTFDPSETVVGSAIFAYINSEPVSSQTFNTTYTVTTDCGEETVDISLTINPAEEPNAGDFNPAPVCSSATLFNLNSLLGANNDQGGTFSDENGVIEDGLFDVSQVGEFEITYTVTASVENCTSGEPDATTFTLIVTEGFEAENPDPVIVCISDIDALFPSFDEIRKFYIAIAQEAGFPTDGTLNPTPAQLSQIYQADEDGLGDFTTTYTFGDGDCQNSVELTVTVVDAVPATVNEIGDTDVCTEDDTFNLFTLIEGNTPGGTFFDADDNEIPNGILDVSAGGDFTITYTVTEADTETCLTGTASTTFTITLNEFGNAGENGSVTLNESDDPINLFDHLGGNPDEGGTWSPGNGIFDPATDIPGIFTYTVGSDSCADSATVTVTVTSDPTDPTDPCAVGTPTLRTICLADVDALFPSIDEIRKFYLSLLDEGVATTGTLSPTASELAAQYQADQDGLGDFSTTYTLTVGECTASVQLTVRIVEDVDAGTNGSVTLNENDDPINLFDQLGGNPTEGGIWSPGNGIFNPATDIPGTFTYTVGSDSCADSATVTVTVTSDPTDPTDPCAVGTPTLRTICLADVDAIFPSIDEIRKFYLSLLDEGVATTGTLSPTASELAAQYQADQDGLGDFSTTYTLTVGECTASVQLTVRIVEDVDAGTNGSVTLNENDDPINLFDQLGGNPTEGGTWSPGNGIFDPASDTPGTFTYTVGSDSCADSATVTVTVNPTDCEGVVNAGEDNSIEVCNSDVRNLNVNGVRNLYFSLLDEGVPTNGTFDPTISQLIDQFNLVSNFGDFTTTYTVTEGECSDSVVLTVTVIEANDAGADMNLTFCNTDAEVNLFDFLSPFATKNGTFEGLTNGVFNPSTATLGETVIIYVVEDDESVCSTGNFTSSFTITVTEPQPANAGGNVDVTFCVDQDENIQLTSLLGEGAIMTGTFSAPFANGVFNPSSEGVGVYAITYTVAEGNCIIGTATATINITVLGNAEAPVAPPNQSFCLVDNPTVGDLQAEGEGTLTWYSDAALTTVAPASTPLTNNAVFYVRSSTGDSACDTSEAVAVTVTLNTEVSPTVQPDGNEFCRQDNPTVQDLIANLSGTAIRIYTSATGGTALATTEALQDGITYYATSTNATTGCESSERRAINVEVGFCGIPEGFSPNGDGINDRFVIPDIAEDFPNYNIEIFNRWGNVVFKGNANTPDWDGVSNQSTTLGDNVLPAGVYFYIVNYNDGSTPPVQGKLYLSR